MVDRDCLFGRRLTRGVKRPVIWLLFDVFFPVTRLKGNERKEDQVKEMNEMKDMKEKTRLKGNERKDKSVIHFRGLFIENGLVVLVLITQLTNT